MADRPYSMTNMFNQRTESKPPFTKKPPNLVGIYVSMAFSGLIIPDPTYLYTIQERKSAFIHF